MTERVAGRLLLVRHSLPEPDPALPASRWHLSEEGRRRCRPLAQALRRHGVARLYASPEPKALETAELAGAYLDLEPAVAAGVEEHHRDRVGWLGREDFEREVARLLRSPDAAAFGEETGVEALARFRGGLQEVLDDTVEETAAVVTHGTVLTLFVAAHNAVEPVSFWRRLGLPAVVALERPAFRVIQVKSIV